MNMKTTLQHIILRLVLRNFALALIPLIVFSRCEDFVSIDPPKTQIVSSTVFTDDAIATSAIRGVYSEMMTGSDFASGGQNSITILMGLAADEFVDYTPFLTDRRLFFTNSLTPNTTMVKSSLWQPAYRIIYYTNSIIEGLSKATGVTAATKRQLEGEAKFIRAFCNFYLVSLYDDIPLAITTDYRVNSISARVPKLQVYQQIVADLVSAQELLNEDYTPKDILSAKERVRPNKAAASALLARVYLFMNDWTNAEASATTVINNSLYSMVSANDAFIKNNREAILQLLPVAPGLNTPEGNIFIITGAPNFVALTTTFVNSFEAGDVRRTNWMGSIAVNGNTYYYPFKYKVKSGSNLTEYYTVLRLAEQYLIRAEARAQQNKIAEAIQDVDIIRQRANLPLLANVAAPIEKEALLLAIEKERRIELFAEWGHRWLDLKRTSRADAVLGNKPNWEPTDILLPIPQSERMSNPNLSQNNGY